MSPKRLLLCLDILALGLIVAAVAVFVLRLPADRGVTEGCLVVSLLYLVYRIALSFA